MSLRPTHARPIGDAALRQSLGSHVVASRITFARRAA
jgi:hypothetical protein